MKIPSDLRHRSLIGWGTRAFLAMLAMALGYVAVAHSLAEALPAEDFAKSLHIAPWHARAKAEASRHLVMAEIEVQSDGGAKEQSEGRIGEAEELAQKALRRSPAAIPAITTLGVVAQLRGDPEEAARWFTYSQKLSRRDLNTQLWLIENAVQKNDIGGALGHYDIALRTKRDAPDLLFPVLAEASTDPSIATKLIGILRNRPAWGPFFVSYLAQRSTAPAATAQLFAGLREAGVPVSDRDSAALIDLLIAGRLYADAWDYYVVIRPGAVYHESRDPHFSNTKFPAAFDWKPVPAVTGLSATLQAGESDGALDFSAPPSVGGSVFRQVQLLPAGNYRLEGRSANIDQPRHSRPYWVLACLETNREIGRLDVPNSDKNGGRFDGIFIVPPECPAQALSLVVRASEQLAGVSGQIEHLQLRPAR